MILQTHLNYQQSHDIHRLIYSACQTIQHIDRISIRLQIEESAAFDDIVQVFVAKKAGDS